MTISELERAILTTLFLLVQKALIELLSLVPLFIYPFVIFVSILINQVS
jgi:hypothetical protein